jgi:transposase
VATIVIITSTKREPSALWVPKLLWRKMMQGTYHEKGDRWVERILSVRETCRLRGVPTFPVLVDAVTCYVNDQHPDVSWISSL